MTQNYIERYWRDATPEDAIKEPPMVARFRSRIDQEWIMDTLQGIDRSELSKWYGKDVTCRYCQVYDAPDPGEGYELIDITKTEKRRTDEYLSSEGKWEVADANTFYRNLDYRRRITPTVTYAPFTWEDREQLRGRWIVQVESPGTEQMVNKLDFMNGDLFANNKLALELLTGWRFLDTGKPVGKEVVQ